MAIVLVGAQENYRKFVTGYVNDHVGLIRLEEQGSCLPSFAAFDEQTTNQFIVGYPSHFTAGGKSGTLCVEADRKPLPGPGNG